MADADAGVGLQELKRVDRADVYKGDQLAAHLTRTAGGDVVFAYTAEWIKGGGEPVSLSLPVTQDDVVTPAGAVPPFFAGLLPEGRRLVALRRGAKTSEDDDLTLVMGIGGNMIGDVRVVPDGESPDHVSEPSLSIDTFDRVRFADLIEEMDVAVDRVGLPGAQEKVSAAMVNLPMAAAGSQIVLKLNPPRYRHLVENEHFFLSAAPFRTVDATLVRDRDGDAGLAVERFDRVTVDGSPRSLAVEDGCQVLGKYPSSKYAVTTEEVLSRLASACEAPVPAAAEFLAQATYAFLTGNGDAHAKNYSILQDSSGRWQPTPAYDIPSTQPYGDSTMALSIDGKSDGNIRGERFVALGEAIGLRPRAAKRVVATVRVSADIWLDQLSDLPYDQGTIAKLKRVVVNRQKMLHLTR